MVETANSSVVAPEANIEPGKSAASSKLSATLVLAALLIAVAGSLVYANSFRNTRYSVGVGVQYPWWNEIRLSSSRATIEDSLAGCEGASSADLFCAMLGKFGTAQQSSNEVAVIKQAMSQDRSSTYCDELFGPCAPQTANITIADARQVFDYLNAVYIDPALEDIARGRVARAHSAIARVDYLLGQLDLPLGTGGCCYRSDILYIAPAYLSDKAAWRNRRFVQDAMSLADGEGHESRFPAVSVYAHALSAAEQGCHRTAAARFSALGGSDSGTRIRELASYMALLSDFRARIHDAARCPESQPPLLSQAERQELKARVTRKGFLTDIAQMDASPQLNGASDAS